MHIGDINTQICSAIVVFAIPEDDRQNLSENQVEYWFHSEYYPESVRINKETKVGQKVTKMLEDKVKANKLYQYLEGVVLKKLKPSEIITIIENTRFDAYDEGRRSKEREIQSILGIR